MQFRIQQFEEIDSTNKYALENINSLEDYSVVSAKNQTAGRGRKGRKWVSTKGDNLYFSLLLKSPPVKLSEISGIPQLMGLAIYKALSSSNVKDAWIKWPNDVFVNNKKICGILCESRFKGTEIDGLVIGVGVNVSTPQNSLDQIDTPATSIIVETAEKDEFKADELLYIILNNFDKYYKKWLTPEGRPELQEEWRSASRLIGKAVKLIDDDIEILGTVADFSLTGEIIIQTEKGFQSFSYGDLSLREV